MMVSPTYVIIHKVIKALLGILKRLHRARRVDLLIVAVARGPKGLVAKTPDAKKQEFRKYLETSGVVDALTKVLVGLYEEGEKPSNAVDYVKRFLGAPTGVDVDSIRAENEQLKQTNAELRKTIEELKKRWQQALLRFVLTRAGVSEIGAVVPVTLLQCAWERGGFRLATELHFSVLLPESAVVAAS
ncbi:hypothetical protein PsorP6_003229 [Peronosclerospora sorghi]|uniref:Uncharacterized protein n=1 Tax=Peronosclerospora sorghi TaxID=230839 RepID=A0ACC0VQ95_9STRA|nr:hypothetical protein PsorP6_003229 [Peronosclerospora sorghi]